MNVQVGLANDDCSQSAPTFATKRFDFEMMSINVVKQKCPFKARVAQSAFDKIRIVGD